MTLPRVLGVDDGFFPNRRGSAPLVGILMRGTLVEGVLYRQASVDGLDVTEKIIDMVLNSKYAGQIRYIMSSGSVFAGTNVLDMRRLFEATKIPVISVLRRMPGESFEAAMRHSPNAPDVLAILRKNPPLLRMNTKRGEIYVQFIGCSEGDVKRVVEDYQIYSVVPEPLRLAHMFASAIGLGESRGRP